MSVKEEREGEGVKKIASVVTAAASVRNRAANPKHPFVSDASCFYAVHLVRGPTD